MMSQNEISKKKQDLYFLFFFKFVIFFVIKEMLKKIRLEVNSDVLEFLVVDLLSNRSHTN